MSIKGIPLSSPIEDKITWAEDRYGEAGEQLLKDNTIRSLLKRLKTAVHTSHEEMMRSGIVPLCAECEQAEGGSCCGKGLENKYDGWLLLINLALGVVLPKSRHDSKSCFFLKETGCSLLARHVICVNYICKKITNRIAPERIDTLREKEGEELDTLFLLHEQIKKFL